MIESYIIKKTALSFKPWALSWSLVYKCFAYLIKKENHRNSRQNALDKPSFHHNRSFINSIFFKEMMEWCNQKQFSFHIFFPEYLKEARRQIYDKKREKNDERNNDSGSHI